MFKESLTVEAILTAIAGLPPDQRRRLLSQFTTLHCRHAQAERIRERNQLIERLARDRRRDLTTLEGWRLIRQDLQEQAPALVRGILRNGHRPDVSARRLWSTFRSQHRGQGSSSLPIADTAA